MSFKLKKYRQPNFKFSQKQASGFAKTALGSIVVLSVVGKIGKI